MAKRKRAFTLVEVMFSAGILTMVVGIAVSVLLLINKLLYDGQSENVNRENLSGTIYYLTREIQSAESVQIEGGKNIRIKPRGDSGYTLEYAITEHYPVAFLAFKGKRLLDIDYENSSFSHDGNLIKIALSVYQNDTEVRQNARKIQFEIFPRNASVMVEVVD